MTWTSYLLQQYYFNGLEYFFAAGLAMVVILVLFGRFGQKSPSGPTLVPFLGIIPGIVGSLSGPTVTKWCAQYKSNIISVNVLGQRVVILSGLRLIKETMNLFNDRLKVNNFTILDPNHEGIIFHSGQGWRDARKIIMKTMKRVGMMSPNADIQIAEEGRILVDKIADYKGNEMDVSRYLFCASSNVTNYFLFGRRFEYDDKKFNTALQGELSLGEGMTGEIGTFVLQHRLGRWILSDTYQRLGSAWRDVHDFVDGQLAEHQKNFQGDVKDFIDALLHENASCDQPRFTTNQIRSMVMDMFLAAPASILSWIVLYMGVYPDIQDRVYQEIQSYFTTLDRAPVFQDKKFTPFTQAVICEVLRLNITLDLGFLRTNNEKEFQIEGFTIPKNTPVFPNLWGVHDDPTTFPEPGKFDPNHFLNENGEVINQDKIINFHVGKRACVGESMGRAEIYIVFVMLVLNFRMELPPGVMGDLRHLIDMGLNKPQKFMIRMIPRVKNHQNE